MGQIFRFDKVVFSIISGTIVFYLFIFPISTLIMLFNFIQKYNYINENDFVVYSNLIIIFVIISLSYIRYYNGNKPLRYDNSFLKSNILIELITIFIFLIIYISVISSQFTTFNEIKIFSVLILIISIPPLYIFNLVFTKIFSKKEELPTYLKNDFKSLISKNIKLVILFMIIISILAALIGMYCLNTTSELVSHNKDRLEITQLSINGNSNLIISPVGYITQIYEIKYQFIPWVKINSNISLVDSSGTPYKQYENYSFIGKNDVIISGSRWSTINASLIGIKQDNLPQIYTFEKKEVNKTHQIWNISFTNPYEVYIKIYRLGIEKDEKLKLINYKINNLDYDKEKLDESIKNPIDKNLLTINDVGIWGKNVNPNQSITLFFEINNAS